MVRTGDGTRGHSDILGSLGKSVFIAWLFNLLTISLNSIWRFLTGRESEKIVSFTYSHLRWGNISFLSLDGCDF